ncbi:serine/threonine protein kinase with Chase2 sensor [Gloeomargarita lithophora Alchichica-D10]|uniref:non-specific serine/threonine protein kinase n=1 Tax=Gloeomargarita lithophora Alchichica-D10 TaxID=1188229 RepID=A0A1J0AH82_9CYAN|nr:CHASE2 domain-containing serine/threonine-protein kinase [Gloeomargarita lithophora]APB35294.1 serine/threonine protein kinase with Chase2 sensor [Gloeomargarita lithophora Alchichica-D10]
MKVGGWRAGIAVALVTLGVGLLDGVGGFTGSEWWVYDRLLRWQPGADPASPLVLVTITPADLQGRERVTDQELSDLLAKLVAERVAVVGVDVIRDVPVGGGLAAQKNLVQLVTRQANAPQGSLILTCFLPGETQAGVLPPPGLGDEAQVVGFADVLPDRDRVVRRSLLAQSPEADPARKSCQSRFSLGFLTALTYLAQQGYELTTTPAQELQINQAVIAPLSSDAGPYRGLDTAGYQVFLRFQPPQTLAPVVTMTQVLQGSTPFPLRHRLVLVGYAQGAAKQVITPLGALDSVEFHAQSTGQMLRVVLGGEPLLWWWPRWGQGLWLLGWSGVGALVGWRLRRRLDFELVLAPGGLFLVAGVASGLGGWVPLVAPGVAWLGTGLLVWWWLPRPLAVLRLRLTRALSPAMTLDPKGRYAVQTCLGQDGLGWVYEATDQHVGKTVVVRVLKLTPSPQRREELRQTFVAQVERYVALDNLHLIQILDFGLTKPGFPFYVREYLPGNSLRQRLRQQAQMAPLQAVVLVRQICKGLEPAHQQGWVHQDLKPEHIFLIPTGAKPPLGELVKIQDFGVTQWIQDSTADPTITASTTSLPYTAPELFLGATPQPSADVYSLGILLYRMISGVYPWPLTEAATYSQWLHAHQHQPPTPLSHPSTLAPILNRCLAKDPHQRYPSASDLDTALQNWQEYAAG